MLPFPPFLSPKRRTNLRVYGRTKYLKTAVRALQSFTLTLAEFIHLSFYNQVRYNICFIKTCISMIKNNVFIPNIALKICCSKHACFQHNMFQSHASLSLHFLHTNYAVVFLHKNAVNKATLKRTNSKRETIQCGKSLG